MSDTVAILLLLAFAAMLAITSRALGLLGAQKRPESPAELDKLRENIEQLIDVLEEKASAAQRDLRSLIDEARALCQQAQDVSLNELPVAEPPEAAAEEAAQEETDEPAEHEEEGPAGVPEDFDRRTQALPVEHERRFLAEADHTEELSQTSSAKEIQSSQEVSNLHEAEPRAATATQQTEDLDFRPYAIKPAVESTPTQTEPAQSSNESQPAPEVAQPAPGPVAANGAQAEYSVKNGAESQEEKAPATASQANADPYAAVYTLTELGVTDVSEIARRTGLGQTEVEMVLNLWRRK